MNELENNPQVQQAVAQAVSQLSQRLDPQVVDKLINMFEFVLQSPDSYPAFRQTAIQSGGLGAEDLPEQFDEQLITIILMALKQIKAQSAQMYARGGLATKGRRGDDRLAHINPFEERLLKAYGGSGGVNPETGLDEYGFFSDVWDGVKDVVKSVAPIIPMVANYFMPGLGSAATGIMSSLGASSAWAPVLGQAAVSGGLSALSGGNFAQGAIGGALGAGGGQLGGEMLGLTGNTANLVGSGLAGGLSGLATGKGFGAGATQGALGGALGNMSSRVGGDGQMASGLRQGIQSTGNMLSAGYSPQEAMAGGALAGLAKGFNTPRPTNSSTTEYGMQNPVEGYQSRASTDAYSPEPVSGGGFDMKNIGAALPLLSLLGAAQTPQEVQTAVASMSPEQREYFDRPLQTIDWTTLQREASSANQSLGEYLASNWNNVSSGKYTTQVVRKARGGALNALAVGNGSGRDDKINALLSDGEYVFDAETTALVGDGSVKEGAKRLDGMRAAIRKHKGKALSAGKISPNAKSPLAYLKEVA